MKNWLRKKKQGSVALLIIAHPDDECMFFTPVVRNLIEANWQVQLLCITSGNADGLGSVRRSELEKSCALLGIKSCKIHDDEKAFPDSMTTIWNINDLSEVIVDYIDKESDIDMVITFDSQGISGHTNHKDACLATRLALGALDEPIELLELETVPLVPKYMGMLGFIYEAVNLSVEATLQQSDPKREQMFIASISYRDALRFTLGAMRMHQTQLVWFRWLYLALSRYGFINSLRRKTPH